MASVSMSRWTRALGAAVALAGAAALVGACGTGGATPVGEQFLFLAVGPGGGVVEAGPVRVVIPPGALQEDTGVAILPQATPLPIVGPDACTYSYVGPIYCCGPVGLNLLVNGTLRMSYDEALIPPGFTELDLVLLEWDNAAGVMRPRPMPPVVQDTAQNFFLDPAYSQLGHVAIGLRDCQGAFPFNLLVQNGGGLQPRKPAAPGEGATEGGSGIPALWAVALGSGLPVSGSTPPTVQVPTGDLLFEGFVPSPNQERVLFAASNEDESSALYTVRVDGAGAPIVIAADDSLNDVFLQSYDPMYGWLQQGAADHVYYLFYLPTLQSMGTQGEPAERYELWRRIGDASAAGGRQHFTDASISFPDDLRQSDDGELLSVYSFDFQASGNFVDVVNVPEGMPVSLDQVPVSEGPQPPRFMRPSDGNDLYMVTSMAQEVNRHTPPGAYVETLFSVFAVTAQLYDRIIDFALAPDGNAFAAVVTIPSKGTEYHLLMGTLADGVLASRFLGFDSVFVNEMVWHPQQTGVFLDLSGQIVSLNRLVEDDGFSISEVPLMTFGLNNVDVNRLDGRIATLVSSQILVDATAAALPPGIYIWPPDASVQSLILPVNVTDPRSVRWLATWRHAPGRFSSRVR